MITLTLAALAMLAIMITVAFYDYSCPICGERDTCGWDDEGRPMMHLDKGPES